MQSKNGYYDKTFWNMFLVGFTGLSDCFKAVDHHDSGLKKHIISIGDLVIW